MTDKSQRPSEGQFLVYQAEDGKLKIDVRFEGETVWLAQQQRGVTKGSRLNIVQIEEKPISNQKVRPAKTKDGGSTSCQLLYLTKFFGVCKEPKQCTFNPLFLSARNPPGL